MKANRPLHDEIRNRAYEIYLRRGGQSGRELDDWLQAEAEFRQTKSQGSRPDFVVDTDGIAIKV